MIYSERPQFFPEFEERLAEAWLRDEAECVASLLHELVPLENALRQAGEEAARLVTSVRARKTERGLMQSLLREYSLNSDEGVVLMCLAEALLRIPDDITADRLIQGKLSSAHWERHMGDGRSLFINASSWSLMLTGRLLRPMLSDARAIITVFEKLVARLGEPVIRKVLRQMMQLLGQQFVMGTDIAAALSRSTSGDYASYRYSYDMLGEAALTAHDAQRYFDSYADAIRALAEHNEVDIFAAPSISVKLSALHPRYDLHQYQRVIEELGGRLLELALLAKQSGVGLTVDAEEADRLELSLALFARVFGDDALGDWQGMGLAVQAYQRRAPVVIDLLADLARRHRRRIPVRLVKGAYWDTEIKRAQERGLDSYPVFTRKAATDVSYLACAKKLLATNEVFYPQFATHNAHTVAAVLAMAGAGSQFEFQRLHGMGEQLYDDVLTRHPSACRTYAPVGRHEDLLPYLVRRLLENGANSSFVNRIEDENIPLAQIVASPVATLQAYNTIANPRIAAPADIFGAARRNSSGLNLYSLSVLERLRQGLTQFESRKDWRAAPLLSDKSPSNGHAIDVISPCGDIVLGQSWLATREQALAALDQADAAFAAWRVESAERRAACLLALAELLQQHRDELVYLCVREAGRSIADALAEVREAEDFCRYYAERGRHDFAQPLSLPGPTGESNQLLLQGRGVFVCISPWNFPIAIFVGQIAAALMAGNTVIAKPASQTSLVAQRCIDLFHAAGVPAQVLQFLPCRGSDVGDWLLSDTRVAGVAFTGSTDTARSINEHLIRRDGVIATFVAETGGQNVMVADSSALPEQLVNDCIVSAFNSAGQRCSALRVLYVQEEIADRVIELLIGAMQALQIGDPAMISTDVGPVIDANAKRQLDAHIEAMHQQQKLLYQLPLPANLQGHFVGPALIEIAGIAELAGEVFGPVLHVVRYRARELDKVVAAINGTGFGLTFGIHSRVDQTVAYLSQAVRAGNVYVNRNMIGAVVGVQPFGGSGLSGTGPKAGGPYYLHRFASERTVTINTAAVGGNAQLLASQD